MDTTSPKLAAPTSDPRQLGWPCLGEHKVGKMRQNKYATWQSCVRCGLRTLYVAKGGYEGSTRSLGPLPDHVAAAQQELSAMYDASQMNDKIFTGKLMEIKGRQLVATGVGSTEMSIRADSRIGRAILSAETGAAMASPVPPTVAVAAKAKAKAVGTPRVPSGGRATTLCQRQWRRTALHRRVAPAPTLAALTVVTVSEAEEILPAASRPSGTS